MVTRMISDEAVEAAHKAWRAQSAAEGTIFEYNLRAALEAVAPYIAALAKKVDECTAEDMDKYFIDQADVGGWLRALTNPYRSQA